MHVSEIGPGYKPEACMQYTNMVSVPKNHGWSKNETGVLVGIACSCVVMAKTFCLIHILRETSLTVGCFTGNCHHCLVTTCVHMDMYRYPLFESEMQKIGF